MSGLCHFGLVYLWFCDRALTISSCLVFWWACGFECARAACSLVYVLCFMLEWGVRIPALLSCFRLSSGFVSGFGDSHSRFGLAVGAWDLEFAWAVHSILLHSLSRFVAHSSFFGCVLSLNLSCSVWHAASVFHWLRAFMFFMFCVLNTRLMSLVISCMFMSRFAHG